MSNTRALEKQLIIIYMYLHSHNKHLPMCEMLEIVGHNSGHMAC